MDFESTRRVLEAFEREGVRYVVFGGAALNLLGLARFTDIKSARVAFGSLTVSVATPDTLYRMKRGTVRLRDRADAEMLRERFHLKDEEA